MTDLDKIRRDRAQEPTAPKRKKGPGTDAFKEMMKTGKVREPDAEEQKKGKSQAEAEEEQKAEVVGGPSEGLIGAEPTAEPSIFTPQAPSATPQAAQPTDELPSPATSPPPVAPTPAQAVPGIEVEPSLPSLEIPLSYIPPEMQQPYPPLQPQVLQAQAPSQPEEEKVGKKEAITAPEKKPEAEKGKQQPKISAPEVAKAGKKTPAKLPATTPAPAAAKEGEKFEMGVQKFKETTPPLEEAMGKLKETEVPQKPEIQKAEEKGKEVEQLLEGIAPPSPLAKGAWEAIAAPEKEEQKIKEAQPEATSLTGPTISMESPPTPSPMSMETPPALPSAFMHLNPQIQQFFDRLVGVMSIMTDSGITQTTLNLDNPQFAQSAFYGAQIVITEYSTAPKAFNIELLGNQQAVQLFSKNTEELLAAFNTGNYNFKVNRVDTSLLPTGEARKREERRVKRKKGG